MRRFGPLTFLFACLVAPVWARHDVSSCGTTRETPNESLLLAAQQGDVAALNNALARGADANAANSDGMTALMFAVQQGSNDCVQTLISRGANLEAKREDGQTAATLAERADQFQILRRLWKGSGK